MSVEEIINFMRSVAIGCGIRAASLSDNDLMRFLYQIKCINDNPHIRNCVWDRMLGERKRRKVRGIINRLLESGFMTKKGHVVTGNNRVAFTYEFSDFFKSILAAVRNISAKTVVSASTTIYEKMKHYTPSFRSVNKIIDTINLGEGNLKEKRNKLIIDKGDFVIHKRGLREGEIYDTKNSCTVSLIDFLMEKSGLTYLQAATKIIYG